MASLCSRCALRLQRSAAASSSSSASNGSARALSTTPTRRRHGVPTFQPTENPELDAILSTMRSKYFIPAALHPFQRQMIFGTKYKQRITDNPPVVAIGEEEVELRWIDRRREIPARKKLVRQAVEMMTRADAADCKNLPALLTGLRQAKATLAPAMVEKIVRLAISAGQLDVVLRCLRQAHNTGLRLSQPGVLDQVLCAVREGAQDNGWSREAMVKAMQEAKEVGTMLENTEHGPGWQNLAVGPLDPRRRPEVIAIFLELAAVYATKFHEGRDVDGRVRAYAERLLANVPDLKQLRHLPTTPAPNGPQRDILLAIPVYHGLRLAQRILGGEDAGVPRGDLVDGIVKEYGAGLERLVGQLEAENSTEESYAGTAVKAWRACLA